MTSRRSFIAGAAALLLAPVSAPARRPAWRRLFDGRSLRGWTRTGDANWRVERGLLVADRGTGLSFLVSAGRYRDFELRAEFWVSAEANSGIFIRCQDPAGITPDNSYEVNIFDARPDPTFATGAIVGVAPVAAPVPRAGGRWNLMTVRAEEGRFDVVLNGRRTVDGARDARHAEGPIALQYASGTVRVRRVDLRRL